MVSREGQDFDELIIPREGGFCAMVVHPYHERYATYGDILFHKVGGVGLIGIRFDDGHKEEFHDGFKSLEDPRLPEAVVFPADDYPRIFTLLTDLRLYKDDLIRYIKLTQAGVLSPDIKNAYWEVLSRRPDIAP